MHIIEHNPPLLAVGVEPENALVGRRLKEAAWRPNGEVQRKAFFKIGDGRLLRPNAIEDAIQFVVWHFFIYSVEVSAQLCDAVQSHAMSSMLVTLGQKMKGFCD